MATCAQNRPEYLPQNIT